MAYIPGRINFNQLNDILSLRQELDNGACLDIELILPYKEAQKLYRDIKNSETLEESHPTRRYGFFIIGNPLVEGDDIDRCLEETGNTDSLSNVLLSMGFACSHDAVRFSADKRFLLELREYYDVRQLCLGGFYREIDESGLQITRQKIQPSGAYLR